MPKTLKSVSRRLSKELGALEFSPPVAHVYDPLKYARRPHELYLERYGAGPKRAIMLGMNPGPWGMGQTGVPFGDVGFVRDFLDLEAPVRAFDGAHPKRPVQGFDCARSEVSGSRLWGWVQSHFGTADAFFAHFFVINYCPLMFLEEGGRNRTPDKLPVAERAPVEAACDKALRDARDILEAEWIVGVGAWATKCAKRVFANDDVRIGQILHPSPASPIANRGWAPQAEAQLRDLGLI